jgi:hypothetical protein
MVNRAFSSAHPWLPGMGMNTIDKLKTSGSRMFRACPGHINVSQLLKLIQARLCRCKAVIQQMRPARSDLQHRRYSFEPNRLSPPPPAGLQLTHHTQSYGITPRVTEAETWSICGVSTRLGGGRWSDAMSGDAMRRYRACGSAVIMAHFPTTFRIKRFGCHPESVLSVWVAPRHW